MSRASDFLIGVIDFFAALLPGALTIGLALVISRNSALVSLLGVLGPSWEVRTAAFVVVAYVVGQILNGLGSVLLDYVYDLLYAPTGGFFTYKSPPDAKQSAEETRSEKSQKDEPSGKKGHYWARLLIWLEGRGWPILQIVTGLFEKDVEARRDELKKELNGMSVAMNASVYQRVRAYLRICIPAAFEDIERLEAEQKFFRTATVGAVVLALIAWARHSEMVVTVACVTAAFLFTRYVSRRRKTVERAYVYFAFRAAVPAAPVCPSSPKS